MTAALKDHIAVLFPSQAGDSGMIIRASRQRETLQEPLLSDTGPETRDGDWGLTLNVPEC